MSLRDDASLILIPSAIKDGEVLVQKPLPNKFSDETGNYDGNDPQGSANLTFTRNSNATRVDANGLVEKVRTNLTLYSNDFSNAAWVKTNVSGTSGQSGYDGTNNGWLFTSLTAANSSYHQFYSGTTEVQTFSVYLKAGTTNWVRLNLSGAGNYYFDIQNGVLGSSGTAGLMPKITAAGNGYYRCSITNTTGNSVNSIYVFAGASDGVLSTSAGDTFYIQAVQREAGGIATDYIETTTTAMSEFAGVTASSVANVPRLDYSGDCPSLLLEPQRTNSCAFSEFIGSYFFYTNASATNNATTSPEGVLNAASIIPDATSGIHQIASSNITASGSFTLSAFVKAGELNKVAIRESNATGAYASFDLSTGTKIEDNVSGASFIESYANGWYRIGVTYTYSGNIRLGINVLSNSYTTGNPSSGATYWSSNGTDKLYVYGLQCELGATYASSIIPTYGTSVTRLADFCSKTGISSLIGQTEGTLFAEFTIDADNTNNFNRVLAIGDGTTNNRIFIFAQNTEVFRFYVANGGAAQVDIVSTTSILGGRHKVAFAYKANDFVAYVDGVQVGSDTSGTIPTCSNVYVGTHESGSTQPLEGILNQALLFTTRLSNADLANLTAL